MPNHWHVSVIRGCRYCGRIVPRPSHNTLIMMAIPKPVDESTGLWLVHLEADSQDHDRDERLGKKNKEVIAREKHRCGITRGKTCTVDSDNEGLPVLPPREDPKKKKGASAR